MWWGGPQNSDEEGVAAEEDTLLKLLLVLRSWSHFFLEILTWRPDLPLNDKHLSKKDSCLDQLQYSKARLCRNLRRRRWLIRWREVGFHNARDPLFCHRAPAILTFSSTRLVHRVNFFSSSLQKFVSIEVPSTKKRLNSTPFANKDYILVQDGPRVDCCSKDSPK